MRDKPRHKLQAALKGVIYGLYYPAEHPTRRPGSPHLYWLFMTELKQAKKELEKST